MRAGCTRLSTDFASMVDARAEDAFAAMFEPDGVFERAGQPSQGCWLSASFLTREPPIVTPDEFGDPHVLGIGCFVNGEPRESCRPIFSIGRTFSSRPMGKCAPTKIPLLTLTRLNPLTQKNELAVHF